MHAVVVRVTISDREAAEKVVRDDVVPHVSQAPGFVAGYWTRSANSEGLSKMVFETEQAACAVADCIRREIYGAVTLDTVEVQEVVLPV